MSVPMPEPRPPTCQLRVASKNEDCVAAYIRRQRLEIGRPLTFDEQYPGITALEAFAGAFAGEVMSGLRLRARKRRIELGEVEGVVKVWLENPLAVLDVIGEEGTAAITSVRLQLYVRTFAPEDSVRALLDETLARSPVYLTLSKAVKVQIDFELAI